MIFSRAQWGGVAAILFVLLIGTALQTQAHEKAHAQSCLYLGGTPAITYDYLNLNGGSKTKCANLPSNDARLSFAQQSGAQEVRDYPSMASWTSFMLAAFLFYGLACIAFNRTR